MCLQLPIYFSELRFFLPNICSKHFILLTKNLVFDKREVCYASFVIGLSVKLYGSVISKLMSYWVASTTYLIVKCGL